MAVVKANFVRKGTTQKGRAKAHIRYIQNRHGKNNEKVVRSLFGRDGQMERAEAYILIDEADKKDNLFRFIISPDPHTEDKRQDIDIHTVTQNIMLKLEEIIGKTVGWTAALHQDHSDIRHVHVLAIVPGRLNPSHLNLLTREATKACLEQRQELDLILTRKAREHLLREEAQWARGL